MISTASNLDISFHAYDEFTLLVSAEQLIEEVWKQLCFTKDGKNQCVEYLSERKILQLN